MENIHISVNIEKGKTISYDIPEEYTSTRLIILEDLKKIIMYLEEIDNNEAKEQLIKILADTYIGYEKCFYPNVDKFTLNLIIEDDYLLFDFNIKDQKNTIIIKRNMQEYYFITNNKCTCYKLEDKRVYEYETNTFEYGLSLEETTSNIKITLDQKVCANCDWSISPELEDDIMEEQGYNEFDDYPCAGTCCLGRKKDNLTCDLHYCESGIMSLRKINNI